MKREISSFLGILLVFFFAVLFGGGALAYYYINQPTSYDYEVQEPIVKKSTSSKTETDAVVTPNSAVTTDTIATDETADWKTYTNGTYGFSFKYPKDWVLKTVDGDSLLSLQINSVENEKNGTCRVDGCDLPNTVRINLYSDITKFDSQSTDLKDYLDKKAALSDPIYTDVKGISFGNKSGYQANMGPNQFGGGKTFFVALIDGKILNAWFYESDTDASANETSEIISTFQFTK